MANLVLQKPSTVSEQFCSCYQGHFSFINKYFCLALCPWEKCIRLLMNSKFSRDLLLINGHPSNCPSIIQVVWNPPLCGWVKCNSDGAALGCPGVAACGGIFRDSRAAALGSFSE